MTVGAREVYKCQCGSDTFQITRSAIECRWCGLAVITHESMPRRRVPEPTGRMVEYIELPEVAVTTGAVRVKKAKGVRRAS